MSGDELERNEAGEALPVSEAAMEAMLRAEFREPREPLSLPAGFKERVLARAAAETAAAEPKARGKLIAFPRGPMWRMVVGGALAASLIGGTFGVELERRQHEAAQRAAQRAAQQATQQRVLANQQFQEASRITDEALEHTRQQLERAGVFENAGR